MRIFGKRKENDSPIIGRAALAAAEKIRKEAEKKRFEEEERKRKAGIKVYQSSTNYSSPVSQYTAPNIPQSATDSDNVPKSTTIRYERAPRNSDENYWNRFDDIDNDLEKPVISTLEERIDANRRKSHIPLKRAGTMRYVSLEVTPEKINKAYDDPNSKVQNEPHKYRTTKTSKTAIPMITVGTLKMDPNSDYRTHIKKDETNSRPTRSIPGQELPEDKSPVYTPETIPNSSSTNSPSSPSQANYRPKETPLLQRITQNAKRYFKKAVIATAAVALAYGAIKYNSYFENNKDRIYAAPKSAIANEKETIEVSPTTTIEQRLNTANTPSVEKQEQKTAAVENDTVKPGVIITPNVSYIIPSKDNESTNNQNNPIAWDANISTTDQPPQKLTETYTTQKDAEEKLKEAKSESVTPVPQQVQEKSLEAKVNTTATGQNKPAEIQAKETKTTSPVPIYVVSSKDGKTTAYIPDRNKDGKISVNEKRLGLYDIVGGNYTKNTKKMYKTADTLGIETNDINSKNLDNIITYSDIIGGIPNTTIYTANGVEYEIFGNNEHAVNYAKAKIDGKATPTSKYSRNNPGEKEIAKKAARAKKVERDNAIALEKRNQKTAPSTKTTENNDTNTHYENIPKAIRVSDPEFTADELGLPSIDDNAEISAGVLPSLKREDETVPLINPISKPISIQEQILTRRERSYNATAEYVMRNGRFDSYTEMLAPKTKEEARLTIEGFLGTVSAIRDTSKDPTQRNMTLDQFYSNHITIVADSNRWLSSIIKKAGYTDLEEARVYNQNIPNVTIDSNPHDGTLDSYKKLEGTFNTNGWIEALKLVNAAIEQMEQKYAKNLSMDDRDEYVHANVSIEGQKDVTYRGMIMKAREEEVKFERAGDFNYGKTETQKPPVKSK